MALPDLGCRDSRSARQAHVSICCALVVRYGCSRRGAWHALAASCVGTLGNEGFDRGIVPCVGNSAEAALRVELRAPHQPSKPAASR